MATATKYTYSVQDDTANSAVDTTALHYQIDASSTVTVGVQGIDRSGDVLDIWMKDALSSGEEDALDALVAAHDGETLPENAVMTVEILEDRTRSTEGTFQGCMWEWTIPDSTGWHKLTATEETDSDPLKFPFDIAMLYASWSCDSNNVGDRGKFVAGEWTAIGAITQNVAVDDTVINVSSTVTANVCKACDLKVDSEEFSRMASKSVGDGTITLESGATAAHTAGAYVYARKVIARRIYFENQQGCRFDFGGNRIGGTRLPANTEANLWYYNADGASKKFRLYVEYVI
jgi:hypothetical protein